jgi:hypothetical protein
LYDAQAKSLAAKNGAKIIQVATGGGDITRPIATNDQSHIYHFKIQTMEKLTSEARILMICIGFYCDMKLTSKTVVL